VRRIHRDQAIQTVARRVDSLAAELELEAGDAEQVPAGARISAGKLGAWRGSLPAQADSVVNCSPVSMHPVTGVAGEPDHAAIQVCALPGSFDGRAVSLIAYPSSQS